MSETVVLKVKMSCTGCSGAVERVLAKMEGVELYEVDLEQQKVTVKGNVQPQAVFEKVSKTGKKTEFWQESEAKETAVVVATDAAIEPVMVAPDASIEPVVVAPDAAIGPVAVAPEAATEAGNISQAPKEAPAGVATA